VGDGLTTRRISGPPDLAVDVAGSGPLVLFLHGVGGNRTNWREQIEALAPEFTAAAWDARGYGDSDDYDGPFAMATVSDDVVRVLDALGADTAHLVGLSMGGLIAQDVLARHPARVRSAVLCDTSRGRTSAQSDEWVETFLAMRRAPLLAGKTPADIAPKVTEGLVGRAATPAVRQRLVESLSALRTDGYLKALETVTRYEPILDHASVGVPCLVVVGEDDRVTPLRAARSLARRIPGARLEVIPGAGHLSNIERPDVFNAVLLDFLRNA
jgi:3-oxoadipate enol-lactonase